MKTSGHEKNTPETEWPQYASVRKEFWLDPPAGGEGGGELLWALILEPIQAPVLPEPIQTEEEREKTKALRGNRKRGRMPLGVRLRREQILDDVNGEGGFNLRLEVSTHDLERRDWGSSFHAGVLSATITVRFGPSIFRSSAMPIQHDVHTTSTTDRTTGPNMIWTSYASGFAPSEGAQDQAAIPSASSDAGGVEHEQSGQVELLVDPNESQAPGDGAGPLFFSDSVFRFRNRGRLLHEEKEIFVGVEILRGGGGRDDDW